MATRIDGPPAQTGGIHDLMRRGARYWLDIFIQIGNPPVPASVARWLPQWMLASPGEKRRVQAARERT